MGGDANLIKTGLLQDQLKSTPPAWAGTMCSAEFCSCRELKSTPPAWAGT